MLIIPLNFMSIASLIVIWCAPRSSCWAGLWFPAVVSGRPTCGLVPYT